MFRVKYLWNEKFNLFSICVGTSFLFYFIFFTTKHHPEVMWNTFENKGTSVISVSRLYA